MSREAVLLNLLKFEAPLYLIRDELSRYTWDSDKDYAVLNREMMIHALNMFLTKVRSSEQLEEWANMIESREDIGFENEQLQEVIFELANPSLHGVTTDNRAKEIISMLSDKPTV